tara:strand:+ start:125 stop:760 length:636 start_codon:yes stop_codon:yes gene_type:complete
MSGLVEQAVTSAVRGGLIKEAVKQVGGAVVRGVKNSSPGKVIKGIVRSGTGVKVVRGLKSAGSTITNLIPQLSKSVRLILTLPQGFGTANTMRVFYNSMRNNLGKISKTVLNTDAAQRLATKLTKILEDKKKRDILLTIFQNARADETWANMFARYAGKGKDLIANIISTGAENVAIDQTANYVKAAVVSVGGTVATAGVTATIVNSTDKK